MKINNIIKAFSLLLVVVFSACSDFEDTIVESTKRTAGNQGVYFPSNPALFELEPADDTSITLKIAREVSTGAVQVPIVVEVNDENVFNVPQTVSFADGESEVEFTVTFPEAAEGIAYDLKLIVEGEDLVNPYGAPLNYLTTTVSRIKWSPVKRPLVYIDGTFATLFGVQFLPMYVEADSVELDASVRYRLRNAYKVPTSGRPDADGIYDGYPYNEVGDFDDSQNWLTTIEIDNSGNVTMYPNEIGVDWGYGMISIGTIYGNVSQNIDSYPLGEVVDSALVFPANSLYFSMANYSNGGKSPASNPTILYLSKEAYITANMKIDNFNEVEYEFVSEGEFISEAYDDASWIKSLSEAVDIDEDNEESEYKDLFYISDLYTEDHGLAFYNIDGVIRIPASQSTGLEVFGQDVFVSQSTTNESSFDVNEDGDTVYTFGLIFHFDDENGTVVGDFSESFTISDDEPVGVIQDQSSSSKANFSIQGKMYSTNPKKISHNISTKIIY